MDWIRVDYLWIIVMFYQVFLNLILMAPIQNELICIFKCTNMNHVWVNKAQSCTLYCLSDSSCTFFSLRVNVNSYLGLYSK